VQATMEFDFRAFDREIKNYLIATGKDGAYVVNRQSLNVAIKTAAETPIADAAKIRAVAERPWWPKFIASRMRKPFTRKQARKVSKGIIGKRVRSRGYVRSGWRLAIAALQALKVKSRGVAGALRGTRHIRNP
jgi:hypothetical protein